MEAQDWSYTYDWRPAEHARVTALLVQEQFASGFRRVLKWAVIVLLVLGAIVALASLASGDVTGAMQLIPLVIVIGVLILVFARVVGWIQAWQLKRTDPNVAHPLTHKLDESGYHVSTRTTDIDLKWAGLHKVRETSDLFLFYYSKRLAYYLPKRTLASPEEIEELRAWIRRQLPAGVPYEGNPKGRASGP